MSKAFIYFETVGDDLDEAEALAFEESDFIASSSGASDAGKPIKLDGNGKIDGTFFDATGIDHGGLSGLLDDDHTQYILVNGNRAFSGDQSMGSNKLTNLADGTNPNDAVNKSQLDFATSGLQDFRESVKDKDLLTPPGSPSTGDRYIIGQPTDTATGAWAGSEGLITEWNGSSWFFEAQPDEGTYCYVEDENSAYIFNNNTFLSGQWVIFSQANVLAGNGISIAGNTISVNFATNAGLKFISNELAVEPNDFAGTGLQDDGADNLEIDFANTATEMGTDRAVRAFDLSQNGTNQGAKILGADPTTIQFSTSTNIQGILEDFDNEIATAQDGGVEFDVGTGGVTIGDVVYISGNNEVRKKTSISTNSDRGIGLALTTQSASNSVVVVTSDTVLAGVLTSLSVSANEPIYWTGSGLSATKPSGSGAYVYRVGRSKNADDLYVQFEYIKKNQP